MTDKKRKTRSDRRHIVYCLTNTVTGEKYVGMTVSPDRSGKKALRARWVRHIGRAYLHGKDWNLCRSIREHGPDAFLTEILHFVRGKAAAHQLETEIKKTGQFHLNTV